jgi:hypothetical protein
VFELGLELRFSNVRLRLSELHYYLACQCTRLDMHAWA